MAIFGSNKKGKKNPPAGGGTSSAGSARANKLSAGKAHDILLHPWFSEKALIATDKGIYAFAIPRTATKADVAGAVHEIYKVTPRKIRIVNLPRKSVSTRTGRGRALRAARHKAYVYLKAGESIQFA